MEKKRPYRISTAKRKVFEFSTLLLTLLICYGIWEAGSYIKNRLPLYVQESGHELTGHRYLFDDVYGWKNIPNWQATTIGKPLSINSKGLRDREYPHQKPAGTKRILVLGDSYTWGYGVGNTEIYTEVLERMLANESSPYEVINAGVSGWGTDQQYLFLVREGLKYSPDLVIVSHFINDLDEILHTKMYGLQKPIFTLQGNQLILSNVPVPKPSLQNQGIVQTTNPLMITKRLFETMRDECNKQDCQLLIMQFGAFVFPEQEETIRLRSLITTVFPKIKDVFYLDLDGEFERANLLAPELIGDNRDNHWDAHGHRKTAEILYRFLQENQLLTAR